MKRDLLQASARVWACAKASQYRNDQRYVAFLFRVAQQLAQDSSKVRG